MDQNQQQDFSYLYSQQTPLHSNEGDPNKMKRIIIGGSALFIFVLIVIGVLMMLLQGPNYRGKLIDIAAEQTEVGRVAGLALDNTTSSTDTKILASNISSISVGSVYSLENYIGDNFELPATSAELKSKVNSAADKRLETAASSNNYDEDFIIVMEALLQSTNQNILTFGETLEEGEVRLLLQEIYLSNQALLESF